MSSNYTSNLSSSVSTTNTNESIGYMALGFFACIASVASWVIIADALLFALK